MTDQLPFRVEYAKSGRASCKSCKGNIGKDDLRLAKITQVFYFRLFLIIYLLLSNGHVLLPIINLTPATNTEAGY